MQRLLFVFVYVLAFPLLAQAKEILPLAAGKFSVTFPRSTQSAPLDQGATVRFMASTETSAPRELPFKGFVLGNLNGVVFVEVSQEQAAYLAMLRETDSIKLQTVSRPDPALVADRQQAAEASQTATIAPRSRQLEVPVAVSAATVESWSIGDILIFPDVGVQHVWDWKLRETISKPADVSALFVAADRLNDRQFNVTIVIEQAQAFPLLQTSMKGGLTVRDEVATPVETTDRQRCYIRHRRGSETSRIEIPCTN